jgi:hypothetical protein
VVGSQIGTLTLDPSFGHNLCFKYSNGTCEPISDIYVSRSFNGINTFIIQWGLTPWNYFLKIQKSIGNPFGNVWVHSFTLSYIPGNMKCDFWASLSTRTFVSHCFGCEPKGKVTTWLLGIYSSYYPNGILLYTLVEGQHGIRKCESSSIIF